MLNYNSPINNHIEYNDISVKEVSPIMKLNLRGKKREFFTTVGKQLDMILLGRDLFTDQILWKKKENN